MASTLIIIDFDLTITSEHTHNVVANAIWRGHVKEDDLEAQWALIKNIAPNGQVSQWQALLQQLTHEKVQVAIASFSAFPQLIKRYLKEVLHLPEEIMTNIIIESWLPENPQIADKTLHIQNIISQVKFQGRPDHVVLVDDSIQNCEAARAQGYRAIEVSGIAGDHLVEILNLSKTLART